MQRTTSLLLLLALSFACEYNKDGIAPNFGSCTGPMERVLAKRSSIQILNRGCAMNQVFYSISPSNSSLIACGQCIPGVMIQDSLDDASSQLRIQVCTRNTDGDQECYQVFQPMSFLCPTNYFCNNEGACKHMRELDLYGKTCANETMALRFGTNKTRICGNRGLSCIQGKCLICQERQWNRGMTDTLLNTLRSVQVRTPQIVITSMCVNGEHQVSNWARMVSGLQDPELTLFTAFGLVTLLYCLVRKCCTLLITLKPKANNDFLNYNMDT